MSKRGGPRPGSGRPKGSGFGRVAQETIYARVCTEHKLRLEQYCEANGITVSAAVSTWIETLPEKSED